MINSASVNVSQHAKERYAERIIGKEEKTDVAVFIRNNETKIIKDVRKMIEYGEMVFRGKQSGGTGNVVCVYLKDTWILLVDPERNTVITLYKIDLGVGDEFNQSYIQRIKEKLEAAQKSVQDKKEEIERQNDTYRNLIQDNTKTITEYKKVIRALEEQNKGYQEVINASEAGLFESEQLVREVLGTLIGRKTF